MPPECEMQVTCGSFFRCDGRAHRVILHEQAGSSRRGPAGERDPCPAAPELETARGRIERGPPDAGTKVALAPGPSRKCLGGRRQRLPFANAVQDMLERTAIAQEKDGVIPASSPLPPPLHPPPPPPCHCHQEDRLHRHRRSINCHCDKCSFMLPLSLKTALREG
ncbi:uncharacterized protein LOC134779753 [Penaeus indicus]|uniref:uncharacterized protein LOC134779753 n=1 Tax=Penaeus indicus TaxID=29960 RepID=UPI00300D35ED